MFKTRNVLWVIAMVVFFLSKASNFVVGKTEIMSPDQYIYEYKQIQKDGTPTADRVSLLEEGLHDYPESMAIRYYLLCEYSLLGEGVKAKTCAKEALKYEPQSGYYAHMYMSMCDLRNSPDEAEAAAKYVLSLCEPQLPPAGDKAVMNDKYIINTYEYLHYCLDAYQTLFQIYYYRDDMKAALACGNWIIERKDDSVFGYDNSLYVMSNLAVYYGKIRQFGEMEKYLDQYLAFVETADEKGDEYKQIRSRVEMITEALKRIKEEFLAHGSEINVQDIFDKSMNN